MTKGRKAELRRMVFTKLARDIEGLRWDLHALLVERHLIAREHGYTRSVHRTKIRSCTTALRLAMYSHEQATR